jgi:transposase InsO family protein
LLDTGTRGANLISKQYADCLVLLGIATSETCNVEVCGAFGTCNTSKSVIKTKVYFTPERSSTTLADGKQTQRVINIEAVVADTGHADLILCRASIIEHHMVRRCPSHFLKVSEEVVNSRNLHPLVYLQNEESSGDQSAQHGPHVCCADRRQTPTDVYVPDLPEDNDTRSRTTCMTCRGKHEELLVPRAPIPVNSVGGEHESDDTAQVSQPLGATTLPLAPTEMRSSAPSPSAVHSGDIRVALIVSKASLLQGEIDDDEIDLPSFDFDNDGTFEDIKVESLKDIEMTKRHTDILKNAFVDGCFSTTVQSTPLVTPKPMTLKVNEEQWYKEKRNQQPPRPQSHDKQKAIFDYIEELLEHDCIEPSQAPAFSQVHMVRKTNGKWRFCMDFRGLNDATEANSWTIPNIKLMLQRMGDHRPKYFAVMDLTAGYFQAPIDEASRKYTAFRTARGTYQWKRVPMGLKGAGSYFQEALSGIVGNKLLYNGVELYLDDLIAFGHTEEEYLDNLEQLFQRLKEKNVSLSPGKCKFGLRSVEYVGHTIDENGISFSEEKRRKVFDFPTPLVQKHLKSFLGLANYFRDHIPNHSTIAAPMHKLVKDYTKHKKLAWNKESLEAFEKMKHSIADCQTLWWMDDDMPVFLHTDASDYGVGAYLFQVDKAGKERPIHFLSKSFSDCQTRWSTIEKECYAIFYSMKELEHLIRDRPFLLRTDHRNLLFINSESCQKVTRWKLAIQEFDFQIEHIPGPLNMIADQMSRLCEGQKEEVKLKAKDVAFCLSVVCSFKDKTHTSTVQTDARSVRPPTKRTIPSHQYRILARSHNSEVGHLGVEATLRRALAVLKEEEVAAWPELKQDVQQFVAYCAYCQKASVSRPAVQVEPYVLSSSAPMIDLAIDTIGPLPADENGNIYIISIIDTFSRYVVLTPAFDCTAQAAAEAIVKHFSFFGVPKKIVSDNGSQYVNKLITELATISNMNMSTTTPYSHEENGISERSHKETLRHLRAIVFDKDLRDGWSTCTPMVQYIMNSSKHGATGVAPAEIITPWMNLTRADGDRWFPPGQRGAVQDSADYIRKLYEYQARIVALVQQRLNEQTTISLGKRKRSGPLTVFPDQSFVLCSFPIGDRPLSKLDLPWQGPFQVVRHNRAEYLLRDLVEGKEIKRVHVSRLKEFLYDPTLVDPLDIARRDSQQFVIESVIQHRGNTKTKPIRLSELSFLVHWQGYSQADESWEPWGALRNVPALHRYLESKGLKSLIPREHR